MTASLIAGTTSALGDKFANDVEYNNAKTMVISTSTALFAYIIKNYVSLKKEDRKNEKDEHKLMFFEGLILGGLGGVIFNQLITNTDANIATSNGQTLNGFYGED